MSNSLRVAAVQQRVLRSQQQVIRTQRTALQRQAEAVVSLEAEVETMRSVLRQAGLLKEADTDNPANPEPEPAPEGPAVDSTDSARGDLNEADVTDEGVVEDTPRAAVEDADLTSTEPLPSVVDPGPDDTADVTKPVAGTQDPRPLDETKTETDVRVDEKTPGSEGTMFDDDNLGPAMTTAGSKEARLIASMRLARARIAAGIADTDDDLSLGQQIAASKASEDVIRQEIDTLEKVASTGQKRQGSAPAPKDRPRGLVPKSATGEREAASFSTTASGLRPSGQQPNNDEFLFE